MREKQVTFTKVNIEVEDDEGIGTRTEIETRARIKEPLPAQCIVTRGLREGTLYIYTRESWDDLMRRMDRKYKEAACSETQKRDIRTIKRYFVAEAALVEVERAADGVCTLPIPEPLLAYFDVSKTKSYISRFVEAGEELFGARWELVDLAANTTALCYGKAQEIYGKELPAEVQDRLELELAPIINNGFLDAMLFEKQLLDHAAKAGWHAIGSGGIGASFVAFLLGMIKVNPLPAHYYCPHCHHFEWPSGLDNAGGAGVIGYDLPEKVCPECGQKFKGDGINIPFEVLTTCRFIKAPGVTIRADSETIAKLQQWVSEEYKETPLPEEPWYIEAADVGELLASDKAKALLQNCAPTFLNQMRVLAIVDGLTDWGQDVTSLDENLPIFRDDIYLRLIHNGMSREDADAVMTQIRKGRLSADRNAWMVEAMEEAGLDPAFIENCKKIRYLRNKADLAEELIWFQR